MAGDKEEHVFDLLPGYVLGSLDPGERRQVELHLSGCVECQAEANSLGETVGLMALAAPDAAPPAGLRQQLRERVAGADLPIRQPSGDTWWERLKATVPWLRARPAWQMASLMLVLALIATNLLWWQRLSQAPAPPEPGQMLAIPLAAGDEAPDAEGFLLVSADGLSGAIVVDDLPQLEEEQQYQLWLIRDGRRDSGALFSVDELGYGGSPVNAPDSLFVYDGVGITIEPAGGSPAPTGDRMLGGTLSFN